MDQSFGTGFGWNQPNYPVQNYGSAKQFEQVARFADYFFGDGDSQISKDELMSLQPFVPDFEPLNVLIENFETFAGQDNVISLQSYNSYGVDNNEIESLAWQDGNAGNITSEDLARRQEVQAYNQQL